MGNRTNGRFPRLLVVSRNVPPAVTGSAIIVGNLAKQFTPEEMIVVGMLDPGRPEVSWSPGWPPLRYATVWSDQWRGERFMRWPQFPWLLLYTLWTLIRGRCEAVLAVYPSEMYLLAAYLVARLTRKPLYGYFHNTYYENHRDSLLARWLQPRVFAYARHIFVMSEGMQRLYQQNYPGLSCSPLVHTFNDPIPAFEPPPLHNPVRLCFSGSINPSCADAATRMAQLVQEVDNVQVTLLTGVPQVVVERTGFVGPKVTVTTVSRDELIDKLREADILLLPHGFTSTFAQEEIQTIFPTKVIEYLISGRSILAHMPGDCFLAEFLRRHNCALIVDEPSVEALKAGLQRLVEDDRLRAELVCNALRAAEQFRAPVVAAHLRKVVTHN